MLTRPAQAGTPHQRPSVTSVQRLLHCDQIKWTRTHSVRGRRQRNGSQPWWPAVLQRLQLQGPLGPLCMPIGQLGALGLPAALLPSSCALLRPHRRVCRWRCRRSCLRLL